MRVITTIAKITLRREKIGAEQIKMRSECVYLLAVLFGVIAIHPITGQRRIVPVDYDATLVPAQSGSCPTSGDSQTIKNSIAQEVRNIVRDNIAPALQCGLGECEANPGVSCNQIYTTNPASPSGWYWIQSCDSVNPLVRVYCTMGNPCGCSGSPGGWLRIAYLNMSDPNEVCPHGMDEITTPVRTCDKRVDDRGDCASAVYDSYGLPYSRVCGRIIGYQIASPDAFNPYFSNRDWTLEEPYVDGVSLTYGFSPRQHIWTFANGVDDIESDRYHCPCTGQGSGSAIVPPFIGNDYFCETGAHGGWQLGTFYHEDPLWDGQGCVAPSTCCTLNNPPWFCKSLPGPTTDSVELRLCADQGIGDENTALNFYEIYVQ